MGAAMIMSFPPHCSRVRTYSHPFETCAHPFAFIPGVIGSYLRVAFYRMMLDSCSPAQPDFLRYLFLRIRQRPLLPMCISDPIAFSDAAGLANGPRSHPLCKS